MDLLLKWFIIIFNSISPSVYLVTFYMLAYKWFGKFINLMGAFMLNYAFATLFSFYLATEQLKNVFTMSAVSTNDHNNNPKSRIFSYFILNKYSTDSLNRGHIIIYFYAKLYHLSPELYLPNNQWHFSYNDLPLYRCRLVVIIMYTDKFSNSIDWNLQLYDYYLHLSENV